MVLCLFPFETWFFNLSHYNQLVKKYGGSLKHTVISISWVAKVSSIHFKMLFSLNSLVVHGLIFVRFRPICSFLKINNILFNGITCLSSLNKHIKCDKHALYLCIRAIKSPKIHFQLRSLNNSICSQIFFSLYTVLTKLYIYQIHSIIFK